VLCLLHVLLGFLLDDCDVWVICCVVWCAALCVFGVCEFFVFVDCWCLVAMILCVGCVLRIYVFLMCYCCVCCVNCFFSCVSDVCVCARCMFGGCVCWL